MRIQIRDLFDPGFGIEKLESVINIPDPQHRFILMEEM
jgi:hypothetical protein